MTDSIIKLVDNRFPLVKADVGEYSLIRAGGMRFDITRYDAEGLGVVSVMKASGMAGLVKMETLIINPLYRDAPLCSYDGINALGKITVFCELFNTLLGECVLSRLAEVRKHAEELPLHETGKHWYDGIRLPETFIVKGGKKYKEAFDRITVESIKAFLETAAEASVCNAEDKRKKASAYVEGLITNGGPSTDVFIKSIGKEKTACLFRNVLFGTAAL